MSKITVDHDKCTACGTCYAMYPELFEEGEDSKSKVISSDYQEHNYDKDEIVKSCPSQAISIED